MAVTSGAVAGATSAYDAGGARTTGWPSVPALTDAATAAVLASGLLEELAYAFGGPFHFVLPDAFDANLHAMREVLEGAGVDSAIYYAKKANKAAAWVERCAANGCGVDVASVGELREALAHGVRGESLVVTGPAKGAELVRLALAHGALVAVDSLDDLDAVITRALTGPGRPARVLLRRLPPAQPESRFGLNDAELHVALNRCAQAESAVRMVGFSFHLSGYDLQPRADLAGELVALCRAARAKGLEASRISIGGGLPISYTDARSWSRFLASQHSGHFHAGRSFDVDGFYPYHSPTAGAQALRALLAATPVGHSQSLAALLRDADVALLVEPGRALLDRAGATVFSVQGVKARGGYLILTVDGTSLSLSEQWFNSEYLPDPRLLPRRPDAFNAQDAPDQVWPASVGAATCLESDVLTWRKVAFPRRPRVGDLLVYPNTAGYQMDSNESPFHDLPLPPKVVIDQLGRAQQARPRWRLDRRLP